MKEQSKTSERELSDEEIANLSDGEFKALVIKMLTELIELGQKMKEQMKDTQNEIKQNIQGNNSDKKETGIQSNDLEQKEEKTSNWIRTKKQESKKNEERLRNLWDNMKRSNIWIIGVTEGEQQQEIETLFEQIMKENFPNLVKETVSGNSRKPRESQTSWTQGGTHQGTSSLSYPRLKIKRKS